MRKHRVSFLNLLLIIVISHSGYSQFKLDLEGNYIAGITYNKVRIPASGGTQFDLAKDLNSDHTFTYRMRLSYTIKERHTISALVAPLTIKSTGELNRDVFYSGKLFPANTPLSATYKFNSYRLTYRYMFVMNNTIQFGAGITGKIREANITLRSESSKADYPDLGFVPLVNFYLQWRPTDHLGVILEGDALASKQGRAEDIFAGVSYQVAPYAEVKGGYRLLEGGADVTNNYNFSFINYLALGVILKTP